MNMHRKIAKKAPILFGILTLCSICCFTACGDGNTKSTQARSDLTTEHVRGLYSGMMRKDIEDLLGTSDSSLAAKETIEVYSLADGSTAVLRYHEDTLRGAYIRDKENKETPLFGYNMSDVPEYNNLESSSDKETNKESDKETFMTDETMELNESSINNNEKMLP